MYHGTIIQIDDCLVSEEILTEYFACDYEKCKGCCCVIGDSGAPLEECEAEAIEKNYHIFSPISISTPSGNLSRCSMSALRPPMPSLLRLVRVLSTTFVSSVLIIRIALICVWLRLHRLMDTLRLEHLSPIRI